MNTLQDIVPPATAAPSETDEIVIGTAAPLITTYFPPVAVARMFKCAIESGLKRVGIENVDARPMFGWGFVLCLVKVQDPNLALRAIRETLQDLGFGEECEIAIADAEERTWRTVQPKRAESFERFLSELNIKLAAEAIKTEVQIAELLLRFAQQQKQKGNDAQ